MNARPNQKRQPQTLRSAKSAIALGISAAMLMPATAFAADEGDATTLRTIRVQNTAIDPNPNAQPGVPYKAKTSGDGRHTRPIAETPQNIQVLTKSQIDDSGYTDLRQILDAQPGITLGTGENGNAFGDRYIIRGQEARSDVFVDGLRDPGMTIRESFATEQVEISKGPNSSFAGRGTVGGAVNSITKQATLDYNFTKVSLGLGSNSHSRVTVDTNQGFGEHFALRANALYGYEDVPDRDPADRERKGLALSGLWAPNEDLDIVLDYYGLRAEDMPDLGSYLVNRKPASDLFPAYAQKQDFLESEVDTVTARVKYRINDAMRLTNITRYGTTDNSYVVTGARQGTARATATGPVLPAVTLSNHNGWQEVDYFANQTNLFLTQDIAGMKNEFIFSLEYADHGVQRGGYSITGTPNCYSGAGATGTLSAYCASDFNLNALPNLDSVMGKNVSKNPWTNDWSIKTVSAAVMDNIDLTDDLTLFLGVRWDRYDFDLTQRNAAQVQTADLGYSDTLFNGHIGLTYQLTDTGMIYASYGTAADINGGESDANGAGYGGIITFGGDAANADPEHTELFEIGTKWNVFNENLLLTASVFQITKTDVMEGVDYGVVGTFNTGENRVKGIEFGAVGDITDDLTVQAGYTVMDAEVLKSFTETNEGKTLSNFADNSAYLQLRYEFTEQFAIGGAAKYESKKYGGQPDTAAAFNAQGLYSQPVPSYTVYDLFAQYRVNKHLDFRLNVDNVTDKEYYTAVYRSGSFLYLGDARSYTLTVNYDF